MQVDKTNDISSYQKRNMAYTAAGLGAGVVAGGAFVYFQKPWLKNGDITDTFIKEVETKADKFDLQTLETSINELKKASETGNFEHLSKDTLELFSEENKQKMKDLGPDKVKELAQSGNYEVLTDAKLEPVLGGTVYQTLNLPLGETLCELILKKAETSDCDWRKLKPLYIQPPPMG